VTCDPRASGELDPGKDHGRTTFTMIDPDKTEAVHRLSSWIRSQARVQEKWEK
jgi:hypothetical protein